MEQKNRKIEPQPRFFKSSCNPLSNYFDAIFQKKISWVQLKLEVVEDRQK